MNDAVLALGGLHVAVLALGGIRQPEVHAHRLLVVVRPQAEGVVAQVLAGLDVVLVLVGPVERDLLALVGDGVDARLVDALGEEVALGVVAAEEAEQVVVDLALQRAHVHGVALEPGAQVLDLGRRLGVHAQRPRCLLDGLGQLLLDLGLVGGLVLAERRLHLRQQVLVEELRHLGALGVHDAVEAEVQVGLVELEQLLQQGFIFSYFWLIVTPSFIRHHCFSSVYSTAQRIVKRCSDPVLWDSRFSKDSIRASRFSMISSSALKISCRWRRCCFSSFCICC